MVKQIGGLKQDVCRVRGLTQLRYRAEDARRSPGSGHRIPAPRTRGLGGTVFDRYDRVEAGRARWGYSRLGTARKDCSASDCITAEAKGAGSVMLSRALSKMRS